MYTSIELLDMVKGRYRLPSDYAAAKKLGLSTQFISKVRQGQSEFGVDSSLLVAELLDLEPLRVIGCTRIQHAHKTHDKNLMQMWLKYA